MVNSVESNNNNNRPKYRVSMMMTDQSGIQFLDSMSIGCELRAAAQRRLLTVDYPCNTFILQARVACPPLITLFHLLEWPFLQPPQHHIAAPNGLQASLQLADAT